MTEESVQFAVGILNARIAAALEKCIPSAAYYSKHFPSASLIRVKCAKNVKVVGNVGAATAKAIFVEIKTDDKMRRGICIL